MGSNALIENYSIFSNYFVFKIYQINVSEIRGEPVYRYFSSLYTSVGIYKTFLI